MATETVKNKYTIKVGHASGSEGIDRPDGKSYRDGKPGDQLQKGETDGEVRIDKNYRINGAFKPDVVLRPKKRSLALNSAKACEAACKNAHIGYSQYNWQKSTQLARNTAYDEAKKVDFDLSKIANDCNTDCTAFVTLCAVAGAKKCGIELEYYYSNYNAPTTPTTRDHLTRKDNGAHYRALTDKKYISITNYLKRGDILVDENQHAVMVLENGCNVAENLQITLTVAEVNPTDVQVKIDTAVLYDIEPDADTESSADDQETDTYDQLYDCKLILKSLTTKKEFIKSFQLKNGSARVALSDLSPNSSYVLRASAEPVFETDQDSDEPAAELDTDNIFYSASTIFTTPFGYPNAVRNLEAKFAARKDSTIECELTFSEPESWGNDFDKGYRVYLLLNGKVEGYTDELIKANAVSVSETFSIDSIAKIRAIGQDDSLQVGIQPWLRDNSNRILFDKSSLLCSEPFYCRPALTLVDKLFLKIDNNFMPAIVHGIKK